MTVATAAKGKRAAELLASGMTLKDIAKELGYASSSGVANLLEKYRQELPREALEKLQQQLIQRLENVHALAMQDVNHRDANVRDQAQRRVIRAAEALARVAGVIKAPPPVVILPPAKDGVDLARLSVDEIESLKAMQTKLLEAPIVAHAEVIDEHERPERNDGEPDRHAGEGELGGG